jgi:hypothetical protein
VRLPAAERSVGLRTELAKVAHQETAGRTRLAPAHLPTISAPRRGETCPWLSRVAEVSVSETSDARSTVSQHPLSARGPSDETRAAGDTRPSTHDGARGNRPSSCPAPRRLASPQPCVWPHQTVPCGLRSRCTQHRPEGRLVSNILWHAQSRLVGHPQAHMARHDIVQPPLWRRSTLCVLPAACMACVWGSAGRDTSSACRSSPPRLSPDGCARPAGGATTRP